MYARPTNGSRDRHECRAGLAARAELAEPVAAEPRDQRDVREGLDVEHECRRASDTALNGRGGVKVGFAGPPFRNRISALVSSPATKPVGAATTRIDTGASIRLLLSLRDRGGKCLLLQRRPGCDSDDHFSCADGFGR